MSSTKPTIGIIYSQSDKSSNESKNLAFYLCAMLASTGHVLINMVAFSPDGWIEDIASHQHDKIYFIPPGKTKPHEAPCCEVFHTHWDGLEQCPMIIVTVNSEDTENCGKKLGEALLNRKNTVVFSLQRGVRNSAVLRDSLASPATHVIEGVVGFAVTRVASSLGGAYCSTVKHPCMMVERLTKEVEKWGGGPLSLLETTSISFSFSKTLTPSAWGTLLVELIYWLNSLTGGTLQETLAVRKHRLILALMVRECSKVFIRAAGSGQWRADSSLVAQFMTPWLLEMALVLPTPLFRLLSYLLGLQFSSGVVSPAMSDLLEGRRTSLEWSVGELISTGGRTKIPSPVCEALYKSVEALETASSSSDGAAAAGLLTGEDTTAGGRLYLVEQAMQYAIKEHKEKTKFWGPAIHPSVWELLFWVLRFSTVLSFVFLLYFLFLH